MKHIKLKFKDYIFFIINWDQTSPNIFIGRT
jgi:hypothetical protein